MTRHGNKRQNRILRSNRGMALLLTLSVISVLIVVTLELNRRVRSAMFVTAATRDRFVLSQMAAGGIHVGMAALVRDRMDSETDSVQEDWADDDKLAELFQDAAFERGQVRIRITDELGKIQVNALVRFPDRNAPNDPQMFLWERFLVNLTAEDETFEDLDPRTVIHSLKDWIDAGDDDAVTGLTGAESDYYQDLDPPYAIRNSRVPHLSDLARVKGVPAELMDGTEQTTGLRDLVTVHGAVDAGGGEVTYPGRVNIGTAPLPVLTALMPVGQEPFAQTIFDFREEKTDDGFVNDIFQPNWYTNVPGFTLVDGGRLQEFQAIVTTSSDVFRIDAAAALNDLQLEVSAVVQRVQETESGKWRCRVLSWETR